MVIGMSAMVLSFTIAGVIQVYLWRIVGLDFMTVRTQYEALWLFLVFLFGFVLFLPGVVIYFWDFFGLRTATQPPAIGDPESVAETFKH